MSSYDTISADSYYSTYHGHETNHLLIILEHMRSTSGKSIIFLAGDSSLDNKYWFNNRSAALNGYEQILRPPHMKLDVCYWLNAECVKREKSSSLCCVNSAIEATSLNSRAMCTLLEQDAFIRDNITPNDVLIVSVGGNDIALAPLLFTIINISILSCCTPMCCMEKCACACPPSCPIDPGCLCCGLPGCLTGTLCGFPLGLGYFVDLFKNRVEAYVRRMVSKSKPKKLIICMIYYLDEKGGGSWADGALSALM
jgi:hypothetical protein